MDPRYGCALCPVLPHPGYLDRLRKGRDVAKQKYALQAHVETNHPDILDWQSLKVDLPKFKRPGNRKRKRLGLPENDDGSNDGSNSSSSEDKPAPKRTSDRVRKNVVYGEDEDEDEDDDGDTITVRPIAQVAQDNEDEAMEDEEMYDAPPPSKRIRRASPPTAEAEEIEDRTDSSDEGMEDNPPPPPQPQADPILTGIPAPNMSAVLPRPPIDPIEIINNSARAAAPYRRATTYEGARDQNIALAASIQNYERVNNSLRDEVRGLLYTVANAIEAGLVGEQATVQSVSSWLEIYAREDTAVIGRYANRITTELSRRWDERNNPFSASRRPAQPVQPAQPLTDRELMPPPPRPVGVLTAASQPQTAIELFDDQDETDSDPDRTESEGEETDSDGGL